MPAPALPVSVYSLFPDAFIRMRVPARETFLFTWRSRSWLLEERCFRAPLPRFSSGASSYPCFSFSPGERGPAPLAFFGSAGEGLQHLEELIPFPFSQPVPFPAFFLLIALFRRDSPLVLELLRAGTHCVRAGDWSAPPRFFSL